VRCLLFFNNVIETAQIDLQAWGSILGLGLLVCLVVELAKWLRRRMGSGQASETPEDSIVPPSQGSSAWSVRLVCELGI